MLQRCCARSAKESRRFQSFGAVIGGLVALSAGASTALGETPSDPALANSRWIVLQAGPRSDEHRNGAEVLQWMGEELASRGQVVVDAASMQEAVEERFGHLPRPQEFLGKSTVELAADADLVETDVARSLFDGAIDRAERALARSELDLEITNRSIEHARAYRRVCLGLVRAMIATERWSAAREKAKTCRAASLDLKTDRRSAPPAVTRLLREIRKDDSTSVSIASDQAGCSVFVNGRRLGRTPLSVVVPSGPSYRVQVECGPMFGRVHVIGPTGDEPGQVRVDTQLESALRNLEGSSLIEAGDDSQLRPSVLRAMNAVGARDALVFVRARTGATMMRTGPTAGRAVSLAGPVDRTRVQEAVARLLGVVPGGVASRNTSDPAQAIVGAFSTSPRHRVVPWTKVLGVSLSAVGAASLALSASRYEVYRDKGRRFRATVRESDDYAAHSEGWRDARPLPYFLAAPGAVTLSVGLGLLAPVVPRHVRRWLSPSLTAVGLGTIGSAVVTHLRGSGCGDDHDQRGCSRDQESRDRAALVALSAFPLFSLPIVHLGEWLVRSKSPKVDASLVFRPRALGADLLLRL